jgi:hypothetical protein
MTQYTDYEHKLRLYVLEGLHEARETGYVVSPINTLSLTCHDLFDDDIGLLYGFSKVTDMMLSVGYLDILNSPEGQAW